MKVKNLKDMIVKSRMNERAMSMRLEVEVNRASVVSALSPSWSWEVRKQFWKPLLYNRLLESDLRIL